MAHMTKAVIERDDILLEIEFDELHHADGVAISSVRVLGDDYRPTGPNLTGMFDKMFSLTGPGEGEPFLSGVAEELGQNP